MRTGANIAIIIALSLMVAPAWAQNITKADWGTTSRGEEVDLYTLKGAFSSSARARARRS